MFKSAEPSMDGASEMIDIVVDDRTLSVPRGRSLAAALLGAGYCTFRRTPVSGQPRGPLCMMGVCFECLVEVDGLANLQACMLEVTPGMRVRLTQGARLLEVKP